jgi:Anthrone oxygenase
VGVNVPANDRLKAAGHADTIDVAVARDMFDERRWVRWNLVRVVLSMGAFAALAWSLVRLGRLGSNERLWMNRLVGQRNSLWTALTDACAMD